MTPATPAARAAEHLQAAIDALESVRAPARDRRRLTQILRDLVLVAAGPADDASIELLADVVRRVGELRRRLPPDGALAAGEALMALSCGLAALQRAVAEKR